VTTLKKISYKYIILVKMVRKRVTLFLCEFTKTKLETVDLFEMDWRYWVNRFMAIHAKNQL